MARTAKTVPLDPRSTKYSFNEPGGRLVSPGEERRNTNIENNQGEAEPFSKFRDLLARAEAAAEDREAKDNSLESWQRPLGQDVLKPCYPEGKPTFWEPEEEGETEEE